jgi:hypothetical protein
MAVLMVKLQPNAAGTSLSPTRWCGTESGHPSKVVGPGDIWNTSGGNFGDPNADNWEPKFHDPQLFQEHVWFRRECCLQPQRRLLYVQGLCQAFTDYV